MNKIPFSTSEKKKYSLNVHFSKLGNIFPHGDLL